MRFAVATVAATPAVFRMKERRVSPGNGLRDWLCFITSEFVLRMFARNVSAEQFFFNQGMIDPFDGFVNLGCVHEADHLVPPAFSSPNNPVGSGMRSRNTTLVAPSRRKSRQ